MAGFSSTGIWITINLEHWGQVLEFWPAPHKTQWPQRYPVSSRCQCIGCTSGEEAGSLWYGTLTTNLRFPSTCFCYISQIDNCRAWMMFVFVFLPLDVFKLLSICLQNHIWFLCFSFCWNIWLPLHSNSVLHDYCGIKAALMQYQILLKEVMLNQKVICYSWLLIKTF